MLKLTCDTSWSPVACEPKCSDATESGSRTSIVCGLDGMDLLAIGMLSSFISSASASSSASNSHLPISMPVVLLWSIMCCSMDTFYSHIGPESSSKMPTVYITMALYICYLIQDHLATSLWQKYVTGCLDGASCSSWAYLQPLEIYQHRPATSTVLELLSR